MINNQPPIKRFFIKGLHYYRDFELKIDSNIVILVGENGFGKTTVLNTLAFILQREWKSLCSIAFDIVEIEFATSERFSFTHAELEIFVMTSLGSKDEMQHFSEWKVDALDVIKRFAAMEEIIIPFTKQFPVILFPAVRNLLKDLNSIRYPHITEEYDLLLDIDDFMPIDLEYLKEAVAKTRDKASVEAYIHKCNEYLVNSRFEKTGKKYFSIVNKFSGEIIEDHQLSTGEQQIIYIFSRLFLARSKKLILLFDEPELSLSLIWQRRILKDIVDSGRCSFLFVITHSPFTFDNELVTFAKGINTCLKDYYDIA